MRLPEIDRADAGAASEGGQTVDDRAEEMLCELDSIIAELEDAARGSAALDARVHFGFRVLADQSPDIAALLISEGISWPTRSIARSAIRSVRPGATSLIHWPMTPRKLRMACRWRFPAAQIIRLAHSSADITFPGCTGLSPNGLPSAPKARRWVSVATKSG